MQLLRCHIVHKKGEHLAPHRVLTAGTGLGTEEGEIIDGSGWAEQDTSTLCSHSGPQVPWVAFLLCLLRDQIHIHYSLWEALGQGSQIQRQGELCQEVLQGS